MIGSSDFSGLDPEAPPPRLLDGDPHHYNVLRPGVRVHRVPAHRVPALGRVDDLPDLLRQRIVRLAEGMELPAAQVWGWGFVRTALCVWEGTTAFEGAWLKVARALDVLGPEFARRLS